MEISLAMGGGGVKGVAHIGVLRALEEAGFIIKAIAGTSAGGMAGAMYLAGYSADQMIEIFSSIQEQGIFGHVSDEQPSLLGVAGLSRVLKEKLGELEFDQLRMPFAVTAVDVNTGQSVVLNQGPLLEAVLATTAIPGIFPAREWGEHLLVDGGVTNPVPVDVARRLAPGLPVVAITLNYPAESEDVPMVAIPNLGPPPLLSMITRLRITRSFQVFVRSMDISARVLAEMRLKQDKPDVIIRPDIHDIGVLDEIDVFNVAERGEQAVDKVIDELHKIVRLDQKLLRLAGGLWKSN